MIVIDRERHELIEGHIALGIDLMQLGRHGRELEALAHRRRSDAEMLGDGLVALLLVIEAHRAKIVERVQRFAALTTHGTGTVFTARLRFARVAIAR